MAAWRVLNLISSVIHFGSTSKNKIGKSGEKQRYNQLFDLFCKSFVLY